MTDLKPLEVLQPSSNIKVVLIVLNRPLEEDLKLLKNLWSKAVFRACADGGSNRLYSCMGDDRDSFIPDIITGDFDSAEPSVLEFYRHKGSEIIKTEDQDYTDFTKCLKVTLEKIQDKQVPFDFIAVVGAFGGRLDHVFANVNTMFEVQTFTSKDVVLYSEGSIACLLKKGKHVIHVDTGLEADWCGLIPVGGACDNVTTTGLKWNLEKQQLKFGTLISTSNTYEPGAIQVAIETDNSLLWLMGYKEKEA